MVNLRLLTLYSPGQMSCTHSIVVCMGLGDGLDALEKICTSFPAGNEPRFLGHSVRSLVTIFSALLCGSIEFLLI